MLYFSCAHINPIYERGYFMRKKLLSLLLTLSLTIGGIQGFPQVNAATVPKTEVSLPKKNDLISGFKVTNVTYNSDSKTNEIQLAHVKSGAKMLILKNDSKNRGFAIGFNTPAENDKGINHILEHSILGGSKKYPSKNMIFDLLNTTYSSFANAFTYQNMTMYPVCSESETQLMKLTDIYMDSVYHPLIATDKKIFDREAWRYELKDANSPITQTGIVYNEMRGSFGDIATAAYYNGQKSIFPDTNQSNISGGKPESILTLTYDEFLKTYKTNYHPSNSFMVLYGDVNYPEYLNMLDKDYLSTYTKKQFKINRVEQIKFTKLVEKNYSYPASSNANTNNKSIIEVVFAAPDIKKIGIENYVGLSLVGTLLNLDSSTFKQSLTKSGIAESYSVSVGADTYQPTIHITATNADPSKKKAFYNLVMKELKSSVKNGLNQELIQSLFASLKFDKVLGTEGNKPENIMANACIHNNIFDTPLVNYQDYYTSIGTKLSSGYLEGLVDTYLVKNTHCALVTTTPKAGLLEKNEADQTKKLATKKASMSKTKINNLVKSTADFNTWNNQNTSKEVLASMNAVSAKDLPVEVKDYPIQDIPVDGYRQIIADADITGVGNIGFVFNEHHLDKEELMYMKFYADLLNSIIPAGKYKEDDLLNTIVKQTNGLGFAAQVYTNKNDDSNPYPAFTVTLNSLDEDYKENLLLIKDMLLHSDLDQLPVYGQRTITNLKAVYQQTFNNPLNLILLRSMAHTDETSKMANYLTGLDYYNFILTLEKDLTTKPKDVIEKLTKIRNKMFGKRDLTVLFAGGKQSQKLYLESLPAFTDKLSNETYPKAGYIFPTPAKREAFTTNTTVQYLIVNSGMGQHGIAYNGKYNVISSLITNLLLIPEIRLKGGAYGAAAGFNTTNYYAYTYRDNNFIQSLATIKSSGTFLDQIVPLLTQEDLDNYITSTFAMANVRPSGELSGASRSMYNRLCNYTTQDTIDLLNQIKSVTIDDIKSMSGEIDKLNSYSNYIVVAPENMIDQNREMFDTITPLN